MKSNNLDPNENVKRNFSKLSLSVDQTNAQWKKGCVSNLLSNVRSLGKITRSHYFAILIADVMSSIDVYSKLEICADALVWMCARICVCTWISTLVQLPSKDLKQNEESIQIVT